jgi:uncharacterized protein
MISLAASDKNFRKAFAQGIALAAVIYAGIYGFISLKADQTVARIQDNLPSAIMLIDRAAPSPGTQVYQSSTSVSTTQPIDTAPETEIGMQVDVPSGPLPTAPIQGLYESAETGMLPKTSETGLTPFEAYKRPFVSHGKPAIALAVRDYGLSAKESDEALALPPEISLILSPYAENVDLWQKKARESGHEVWLFLPLENDRFLEDDPGPRALLTRSSLPDNQKRLAWILSRATGYAGIAAETDKTFIDMHAMLGALMSTIYKRGLGYLELNTQGSEFLETLAISERGTFIQLHESNAAYNDKVFTRLEEKARKHGFVTTTMALTPRNLEAVKLWALSLTNKNVVLAPISAAAVPRKTEETPQSAAPAEAISGPVIINNE